MGAFLHHLFRALSGYVQKWTKQNIPSECPVLHDFGDGEGAVPAAPVDLCSVTNNVIKVLPFSIQSDTCGIANHIISTVRYETHTDKCGVMNKLISVELL